MRESKEFAHVAGRQVDVQAVERGARQRIIARVHDHVFRPVPADVAGEDEAGGGADDDAVEHVKLDVLGECAGARLSQVDRGGLFSWGHFFTRIFRKLGLVAVTIGKSISSSVSSRLLPVWTVTLFFLPGSLKA
ncbi:MAG: hypothetical protein JWO82_3764 [Akkermansiaceae bacterium]|nr:hypothetical protein [Akkermansiaceae bacterium]